MQPCQMAQMCCLRVDKGAGCHGVTLFSLNLLLLNVINENCIAFSLNINGHPVASCNVILVFPRLVILEADYAFNHISLTKIAISPPFPLFCISKQDAFFQHLPLTCSCTWKPSTKKMYRNQKKVISYNKLTKKKDRPLHKVNFFMAVQLVFYDYKIQQ